MMVTRGKRGEGMDNMGEVEWEIQAFGHGMSKSYGQKMYHRGSPGWFSR